jgi:hypothetical protein
LTYNFDPDKWLENNRELLEQRKQRGELTPEQFQLELADLERRYQDMVRRLDGTYRLPPA